MKKKMILSLVFALFFSIIVSFVFQMGGEVNGFDDENWIINMITLW